MRTNHIAAMTALLLSVGLVFAPAARATLTFSINNGNSALAGDPTPFGTVDVTWGGPSSANTATVVVMAAAGYSFGDGGTLGLNLGGGGTFTVSSISGTLQNGNPISLVYGPHNDPVYSVNAGQTEDGFGSYSFNLDTHDGASFAATYLTFVITTSGTWANENAILTPNTSGFEVAGHVFPINTSLNTGYATGALVAVPETGTIVAGVLLMVPFAAGILRILRKQHLVA